MKFNHLFKYCFFSIIVVVFLFSCSTSTMEKYYYVVNNLSDKELNVYVKTSKLDSTFNIKPHTEGTIYTGANLYEGDPPTFVNPYFLSMFKVLTIETLDKKSLKFDCKNMSKWKSSTISLRKVTTREMVTYYKLNINNSDLN